MYTPKNKILACLSYFFNDDTKAQEATDYIMSKRTTEEVSCIRKKKNRVPVSIPVNKGPISEESKHAIETPPDTEIESSEEYSEDDN